MHFKEKLRFPFFTIILINCHGNQGRRWDFLTWRGERVIEPIKCMRSPHTSYRRRGERVIESIKCCAHRTPATGGEERES